MTDVLDLGAALDAAIAAIAAEFETFETVAAEDANREELALPAIVINISGIEPDPEQDVHDGTFPAQVLLTARVVLGHRTPKVRRETVKAAAALAAFVNKNRLGSRWGGGVVNTVDPDEFSPIVDTHDVWLVEWAHTACLGPEYQLPDGIDASDVYVSFEPETGVPNEPAYVEVTGE